MATAAVRLPSLDGLRAFEAAARLGTFEKAADELAITASAVGKRIGALEELLGLALFQRGAKTLALSAGGKEYLENFMFPRLIAENVLRRGFTPPEED